MQAYQSSEFGWLADRLGEHLFAKRDPFAIPSVVVPTGAVKEFLLRHLAARFGVAMGIRFLFLEEAIGELGHHQVALPSRFEMALRVDELLKSGDFGPLSAYLKGRPERRVPLSYALAGPLVHWGVYGGSESPDWMRRLVTEAYAGLSIAHVALDQMCHSMPLHLFGFTHIPPVYLRYFLKGSPTFYLFSPCAQFWTDIQSERIEGCEETHPLLANWGGLHRQLLKAVEEAELEIFDYYPVPKQVAEMACYQDYLGGEWTPIERPWTLLAALQSDLILMRAGGAPLEVGEEETLRVFAAQSKLKEVEICAEEILKACQQGLSPSDIMVMAPDITPYVPYIEAIFDREGIPYSITDIQAPPADSLEVGLLNLIALIDSRWEASRLMQLLRHPLFAAEQGLSEEELSLIERWIREASIRWGRGEEHWGEVMVRHYDRPLASSDEASWERGFDRLFRAMTCLKEEGGLCLPLTEAATLGKFRICYKLLEVSALEIYKGRTLEEWEAYWTKTGELLFGKAPPSILRSDIAPVSPVSFESIRPYLEERWGKVRSNRNPHRLDGVFCCSLLPMRMRPSQALFLLGMDEGSYPRRGRSPPFDPTAGGDPIPSPAQLDRSLFLEALLSAKRSLTLSYCGTNQEDGQPQSPSPLIDDLLSCIRSYTTCAGEVVARSPSPLSGRISIVDGEKEGVRPVPSGDVTIDIRDLRVSASDPLRLHAREVMGIDMDWKEANWEDEEPFHLDALEATLATWSAAGHPNIQSRPTLPSGPFGQVFAERIAREAESLRKEIVRLGGKLEMLQPLPFELELDPTLRVRLVGELGPVSREGLVIFSKGSRGGGLIRAYPHLLLFALLVERDGLPYKPQLHFIREGKSFAAPEGPLPLLKRYLRYHLRCLQQPAPLHADLVAELLQGKPLHLSEHGSWIWPGEKEKRAAIANWKRDAVEVFGGCFS